MTLFVTVDWAASGTFNIGTPTGASASNVGTPATPNYVVATNADAADTPVGSKVVLYTSGGAVKWPRVSTVISAASAFGFTNVLVADDWPALSVSGDVLKVVTPTGADVTDRQRGQVSASFGRDQSTALAPVASGRGALGLDNASRDYSPRNASSPLFGDIKPARPTRLQRGVGSTLYTLFVAHTSDSPINPDVAAKTVSLSLVDALSDLRGPSATNGNLSTALYSGVRTGEAIGHILDAIGWPAGRDLDVGATIIPWWWEEGTDPLTALQKVLQSEGSPALITIGPAGEFVFRDRHHRLIRSGSLTSQATFRGDGAVEPVMNALTYDDAWANVINSAAVAVDLRQAGSPSVVWTWDQTISLAAGQTIPVTANTTDPFFAAITPDSTDMVVAFGTVTATLSRTSGASTTISLTAGGSPAQVTALQLRATPVTVTSTSTISGSDSGSITDYGLRSLPSPPVWAGADDTQAIIDTTIDQRAQPLSVLTVRVAVGTNTTRAVAVLGLDLSDRVTVIEPETQTSGDFFIESITHEFSSELDHAVTFGLEAAPTVASGVMVLNSGLLNTGKLGA